MYQNTINLIPYTTIKTFSTPSDSIPTNISKIGANTFWNTESTKGSNIKIAILDTGCDITHPDLIGQIAGVRNFTPDNNGIRYRVDDYTGHGTHVAGIIAANSNGSGIVGIAPNASLYILKVLTSSGGTIEWLINAINYAIFLNVDIISMSLGTTTNNAKLHNVIKAAVSRNILVVCAAGNSGDGNSSTTEISYPAGYPESICIGSIDATLSPSNFTNSNDNIDLVAPGENIVSTYPGGLYASMSGTSMAAPHVTGALALIIKWANSKFTRTLTEPEIFLQLIRKTVDLGYSYKLIGNGLIYLLNDSNLLNIISS